MVKQRAPKAQQQPEPKALLIQHVSQHDDIKAECEDQQHDDTHLWISLCHITWRMFFEICCL